VENKEGAGGFEMNYFELFLQTLLIEIVFLLLFFRKENKGRVLLIVTLANAITHPWVVFGWVSFPHSNVFRVVLLAELFAVTVEAVIYLEVLRVRPIMAFTGSLLANLLSWELGPRLSFFLRHYYSS
jgi:hypothetical protein